jgi:hypothetical protein
MSTAPHESSQGFSPFSAVPGTRPQPRKRTKLPLIVGAFLLVALLGVGAIWLVSYLNDPFRKLEPFPVDRYFADYHPLAGLTFRISAQVEADLGWKDGMGRLMAFTPSSESRQLAVFIPPSLSGVFFNKGQNYMLELRVKEGGLIYATACRKE